MDVTFDEGELKRGVVGERGGAGRHCLRATARVTGVVLVALLASEPFSHTAHAAQADHAEPAEHVAPLPPIPVRTEEQVHVGCPNQPSFVDRLTDRLPRIRAAVGDEQAVRVEIIVERRGNLSRGKLVLDVGAEHAERVAASPSCEEVIAALAVMAAIGLDAGELPAPLPSAPPDIPPPLLPPSELPPPAPRALARPVIEHPLPSTNHRVASLALGAGIEVSSNGAPIVMPTLFAEVGFRVALAPSLRLGVGRSVAERFSTPHGSANVQWSELRLGACSDVLRAGSLRVGPCIEGAIGRMDATTLAPLPFRTQSRWWGTAGAAVRLAWHVHPAFSIEVNGGARTPLVRHQFFFEPGTTIYTPPTVVPFAGAAFVAHLP